MRRVLHAGSVISCLVVAGSLASEPAEAERRSGPRVLLSGKPRVVFDWSREACDPHDIPDAPARAFRDFRGRVQLFSSHTTTRRFSGRSLRRLEHSCAPAMRSHADPAADRFNDREWLASTYTRDGRVVHALVHNEYTGNLHPGRCRFRSYHRCWFNAITLALSTDGGRSFSHAAPPRHLVASLPYRYGAGGGRPFGYFQPSNIVYRRADGHFYVMVRGGQWRRQALGTCLLRTRTPGNPGSWRAWDGSGFRVNFVNPYARRVRRPGRHVCRPVAPKQIGAMTQSLTWNAYFKKYMLVGVSGYSTAKRPKPVWGFYFSLSDDLIHWTRRRLITRRELQWTHRCGDRDPEVHPSILDPRTRSRNFEVSGRRPYLFFVRVHYRRCRQTLDRDLLRVRLRLRR